MIINNDFNTRLFLILPQRNTFETDEKKNFDEAFFSLLKG